MTSDGQVDCHISVVSENVNFRGEHVDHKICLCLALPPGVKIAHLYLCSYLSTACNLGFFLLFSLPSLAPLSS